MSSVACGTTTTAPNDGSSLPGDGGGSNPEGGSLDAAADAAADASGVGTCSLAIPTTTATYLETSIAAPTPKGGTIVPGTYVATTETLYTPNPQQNMAGVALIYVFGATSFDFAQHTLDGNPDGRASGTYETNGTNISFTETCSLLGQVDAGAESIIPNQMYTATPTSVDLFLSTSPIVDVFHLVKQ